MSEYPTVPESPAQSLEASRTCAVSPSPRTALSSLQLPVAARFSESHRGARSRLCCAPPVRGRQRPSRSLQAVCMFSSTSTQPQRIGRRGCRVYESCFPTAVLSLLRPSNDRRLVKALSAAQLSAGADVRPFAGPALPRLLRRDALRRA